MTTPAARAALAAVRLYQRFISPRKGYGCAYRRIYGGSGCSGVGSRLIRRYGLLKGWALLQRRFAYCRHACAEYRTVSAQRRYQQGFCDIGDACDPDCADVKHCLSGKRGCDVWDFCDCAEVLDCGRGGDDKKSAKPKKKRRHGQAPEMPV